MLEAQDAAGLPGEFCLVTVTSGQLLLTPAADSFLRRARWEGEIATGWHPHDDQDSTVLIDPTIRFGRPAGRRWHQHRGDLGALRGRRQDRRGLRPDAARCGLGARLRETTTGAGEAARRVSRARPGVVRFYLDADVLGLAHVVAGLRSDATYPGDPGAIVKRRERSACPIADRATKDDVWIPQVASRGWLIITRDSRIQQHRAEIAAVRASNARMFALSGDEARGRGSSSRS